MMQEMRRGQTTIEYLLLISVVILLFVGVLATVNSLRQETQKPVNISGEEQGVTEAIGGQLENLRQISGGAVVQKLPAMTIELSSPVPCVSAPLTITFRGTNGTLNSIPVLITGEGSFQESRTSDGSGAVQFTPSAQGTFTVQANATGYEPGSRQFTVTNC